jgi:imidazolonepropionase-like amidohydrolase
MNGKRFLLLLVFLVAPLTAQENPSSWGQPLGEYLVSAHKIVVSPQKTITNGQLHIKDGKVHAVGANLSAGPGARRIDFPKRVIHAGFIDPYVSAKEVGLEETPATPISGDHPKVHDDFRIAQRLDLKKDAMKDFRELGFVAIAVAPEEGIFRGQSAVYITAKSNDDARVLLKPDAYSVVAFEEQGWGDLEDDNYPLSMMGNVALIRQTFLDCEWYAGLRPDSSLGSERPDYQGTLESLRAVQLGQRPLLLEASDYLETLRILNMVKEIGIPNSIVVLSGQEWKGLDWFTELAGSGGSFIVPLDFPKTVEPEDGITEEQLTVDVLRNWFAAPGNPGWLRKRGVRFALTTHGMKSPDELDKRLLEAVSAGLNSQAALAGLTTEPAKLLGLSQYGTLEPGKSASFVVRQGDLFSNESTVEEVWIDGHRYPDYDAIALGKDGEPDEVKPRSFVKKGDYSAPPSQPYEAYSPQSTVVKGATLWTQDTGTIKGDLLIKGGKIVSVGGSAGAASHVIDGTGLHVTPGLIDAHSHTAIDGMVNEPGKNITAMVRMKDVLDPFDHDIYLQLASGITTANILHGSANAIGGQAITTKWRYGEPATGLIMKGAPEGIKFALGENPKQSNWGDAHRRYPQSRMGVVELIRGAFISARNYRKLKAAGKNPKPDLMLDALVDVLEDRRLVHCHSYRQDEILALIRVADEVGFKVHVFQHVLEGYKVADALVKHGAGASTFADWWAYKVEVDDAIPYNASLMTQAGVVTSVNSDSPDLARRMNTEAAKSMRYGGLSAEQSMDLITKSPAHQLGVLDRIGTLTPGKDADFVIWDGDPLSQNSVVLQTWIDGKRYFERGQEAQRVEKLVLERKTYLELMKKKEEKKS